jgi:hypothetical protein
MSIAIKRNFTIPSTSAIGASELYLTSSVASTTTGTGALQVAGGAGISGVVSLGGALKFFNGNFYTGFDSAATANTTYIWPATSPSTGTSVLSSDAAGNLSWILMSASGSGLTLNGLSATTQYFSTSISGSGFTISSIGSTHTFYIGLAGNASTGLISSASQTLFGLKTFASGVAITSGTASTSTATGDLITTGGVGIGGSLWTSTTSFSSISGVGISNSVVTSGVWSGTAISAVKGGTGIVSYTTGDILYASSSTTLGSIAAGTAGSVLTSAGAGSTPYWAASTGSASGMTLNGLTAATQFFATSISGSGFTIGSTGSTHTFYVALAGNASTGLISSAAQTIFGLKTFGSGVAVSSGTASTNTTTGALTVAGGVGITGQLSVNTIALGTTAVSITPSMIFTGTAGTVITMSVLSDTTLAWEGSSGQLFSIDNNLSSGEIFSVSDISGLPVITASAGQTITLNEFGGFTQVGNGLASTNTTTGALRVIGGVGITGSLYLGSPLLIPSGGTGLTTYTTGDILYASSSTTLARITAGTAGSVLTSAGAGSTPYWAAATGVTSINGLTSLSQTFATSISGSGFTIGSTGSTHTYYIALAGNASTGLISGAAQTIFGLKTFASGVAITSGTASTSTSTGDLVVSGGVGIGGSLWTGTSTADSISGVVLNNGIITTGTWAGSTITTTYGGTGYSTYTKGDILVGTGSTLAKLPVGSNLSILTAESSTGTGLSWKPMLTPTYGAFGSTASQPVLGANTETLATFNLTYEANNVSIGSGTTSRVYINETGIFNIQFSAQVNLSDGNQPKEMDMWFKIDGVAVPQSNTRQTIAGKDQETIFALNFVSAFISGQYVELAFSSSDPHIELGIFTGLTSPTRPDIPSLILTVTPVSNTIYNGGTAITGLASLNLLTSPAQTFSTGTSGSDFGILSTGSVHTFNIPDASISARGLITTGSQTLLGIKSFASGLAVTASTGSTSTSTGALIVTGGVGIGGTLTANNIVTSTLTVGVISDVLTASIGTTNTTPDQVVHSISASTYRTLKYVVSIASSSYYQGQEILVVHNGTDVWMTEYAQILTGGLGQTLSTFEADINSGNVRLLVTPTYAVTDYKLSCTAIKV